MKRLLEKGSPAYIAVKLTGGTENVGSEAHRFVSWGRGRDSAPSQNYSAPSKSKK